MLESGNRTRRFIAVMLIVVASIVTLGLSAAGISLAIMDQTNLWTGTCLTNAIGMIPMIAILKRMIPSDDTNEKITTVDLLSTRPAPKPVKQPLIEVDDDDEEKGLKVTKVSPPSVKVD